MGFKGFFVKVSHLFVIYNSTSGNKMNTHLLPIHKGKRLGGGGSIVSTHILFCLGL
jgi:hypothetical protein